MKLLKGEFLKVAMVAIIVLSPTSAAARTAPLLDGSRDVDVLIGNWKAHVRVLRER